MLQRKNKRTKKKSTKTSSKRSASPKPKRGVKRIKKNLKSSNSGFARGSEISETDFIEIASIDKSTDLAKFVNLTHNTEDGVAFEEVRKGIILAALGRTLNWYNANSSIKDQKRWVLEYVKTTPDKKYVSILNKVDPVWFKTAGSLARMNLLKIEHLSYEFLYDRVRSLINRAKQQFVEKHGVEPTEKNMKKKKEAAKQTVSVQERTKAKIAEYIKTFDDELHKQIDKDEWKPKVLKKMFNDLGVKKRVMNKVREHFVDYDDDMVDVIDAYLEDL